MRSFIPLVRAAPALLLLLGACDRSPAGSEGRPTPVAKGPVLVTQLACEADLSAGTLECGPASPNTAGIAADVTIGGQGRYVKLTSTPPVRAEGILSSSITVQNLIPQPLGTPDGTQQGRLRVFFSNGPTVTLTTDGLPGTAEVWNETGSAFFTAANQPYFEYAEILPHLAVSQPVLWQWMLSPNVSKFTFTVFVSAEVPFPDGWVDVAPASVNLAAGATQAFTPTVRTFLGDAATGQAVAWASADPGVATVDAQGVVTGKLAGTTTITATSGARSGTATITVASGPAAGVAGATTLGGVVSQPLPDSVTVRVVDAGGNGVAGVTVTWAVLTGGGFVTSTAGVSRADGTVRTRWTLGSTVGAQTLRASATIAGQAQSLTITAHAADRGVIRGWTGASSTEWSAADNWQPVGVPIPLDSIVVPGTAPRFPRLAAGAAVARLEVQTGAVLDLGGNTLAANGDVLADGPVTGGRVILNATSRIRGRLPALTLRNGVLTLDGPTEAAGAVAHLGGNLVLNGQRLRVSGDYHMPYSTSAGGVITMDAATDELVVEGDFVNESAVASPVSAGSIRVLGNVVTANLNGSGTHRLVMEGSGPRTLHYTGGYPQDLIIRGAGAVRYRGGSPVSMRGSVVVEDGAAIQGAGETLGVAGGLTTAGDVALGKLLVGATLSVGGT